MGILNPSLANKVAIVTGSRRGIGKAIALAFAEAGSNVIVSNSKLDDGELERVAEDIRKLGQRSLAVQADVRCKADVDNLVQKAVDEFSHVDILVNNAGIPIRDWLLELNEEDWDAVIDTNLKGCYLCCQAVGKIMVNQKRGNMINIASTGAMRARKKSAAYCVAKAGVVMFTKVLALELGCYNIWVNAIAPGPIRTKMTQRTWNEPGILKHYEAAIPLGRIGELADIISPALFLASDVSNYITGHTIIVDGGGLTSAPPVE